MYEALINEETKPWRDLLLVHQFAIDEIRTKLNILDEEFRNYGDYNPIEHIRQRVKKCESIKEKLIGMGLEPTPENAMAVLHDIAGIRIICAFTADIYRIVDLLDKQFGVRVLEIKDYILNPKENGYKSLHLIIECPVFLSSGSVSVRMEIQLRTIAMDFWASIEHKIYYKYREKAPDSIQNQLKECADMIARLDDRMYQLKNDIFKLDTHGLEPSANLYYREKIYY
jgi:putative GTP pyrophosphokinase